MANLTIKDIIVLSKRRKTVGERSLFLFQGFLFFPFLKMEEIKAKQKSANDGSLSASGDDVYPLF